MAKQNIFNSIELKRPNRNVFDLSHDVKMSLDMGTLYPTMVMECIPGDKFNIGCESLLRFAPLVSPVMHRMNVFMHYFFVPNRLLWDGWEKWIVSDPAAPAFPYLENLEAVGLGGLLDYLGVPKQAAGYMNRISALPLAAYQFIYNEYYRDQNLIPEVNYKLQDGDNTANFLTLGPLRRRAWQHDYFTAALPFAQKGAAVDIPLGEVQLNGNTGGLTTLTGTPYTALVDVTDDINPNVQPGHMFVEPTTINDLRRAFKLQEWLEKNARGGTRYTENILIHFAVKSPDARLQRPEYITGTKSPVVISEVLNTTGDTGAADPLPQGNMAGHGISVTSGKYGSYYCQEHGYIMGIMSVLPLPAYQQGFPKHFLKYNDPFQYFWPSFAHIGEQEVLQQEIYADTSLPNSTFGYVPRYAEYKYMPSRVAGDFRTTLDFWHLGRIFETEPHLNQQFIECDPGKRIFAVESSEDSLYAHVLHKIKAIRPMPVFGTPSF